MIKRFVRRCDHFKDGFRVDILLSRLLDMIWKLVFLQKGCPQRRMNWLDLLHLLGLGRRTSRCFLSFFDRVNVVEELIGHIPKHELLVRILTDRSLFGRFLRLQVRQVVIVVSVMVNVVA